MTKAEREARRTVVRAALIRSFSVRRFEFLTLDRDEREAALAVLEEAEIPVRLACPTFAEFLKAEGIHEAEFWQDPSSSRGTEDRSYAMTLERTAKFFPHLIDGQGASVWPERFYDEDS